MPETMNAADRLSRRQIDCLRLVAQLKKTEQIADELGISPSTVNTHIERAMTLLGARSRREAATMVIAQEGGSSNARPQEPPTEFSRLSVPPAATAETASTATQEPPRRNTLDMPQRLGVALLALVLLCLAIAGLGAAIEQLSAWRSSLVQERHASGTRP